MANPPPINFAIPFAPVAVGIVVTNDGVLPDGTNPGVLDTTSAVSAGVLTGDNCVAVAVDPANNRRLIVSPKLLTPGGGTGAWTIQVSCGSRPLIMTITGTTPSPPSNAGVTWDNVPVGPA